VPTLAADDALGDCLASLERQTWRDFEVVVVDNSGEGAVRRRHPSGSAVIVESPRNLGFGGAFNLAYRRSQAELLATLNDDAMAEPEWLEALVRVMESRPDAGMCASSVRLYPDGGMDSAGMLLCGDGSSKQRGHGCPPVDFGTEEEALFPSGSAALYRRVMLDQVGLFDEDFFLYCEDTDLGLRARWAGWKCIYVPGARVHHRYSHSAGRASALKAYYVERNRLFVVWKNFPPMMLARVPFIAVTRYLWHALSVIGGQGAAGRFRRDGGNPLMLVWYVIRAHAAAVARLPRLLRLRRKIRQQARLTADEFRQLTERHSIGAREVAVQ